jgi:hypothetical protein
MTLNDLAIELLREHSVTTEDVNRIQITEQWINSAISEIADILEWRFFQKDFTITTSAGIPNFELPAEFVDFKYLRDKDTNLPIDYIDPKRLSDLGVDLELISRPYYWWYIDRQTSMGSVLTDAPLIIRLHPIPDSTYTIDAPYYFHPGTLATDDTIPLPRNKIEVIRERVKAEFMFLHKEYEGYDRRMLNFQRKLAAAIDQEKTIRDRDLTLQARDLPSFSNRKLARFDPAHFQN